MNVLPPLPIMELWRKEGFTPEQVRDLADTWVREARAQLVRSLPVGKQRGVKEAKRKKPGQSPLPKPEPRPRPSVPSKLPGPEILTRLFLDEDKTIYEIGDMYDASGELVRQHLKKAGITAALKRARKKAALLERIRELSVQGLSPTGRLRTMLEIQQELGYKSGSHIYTLAREAGLEVGPRPFICDKCDTEPYAKGLCKRCYELARKGKISAEDAARAAERARFADRPGPKKGPKPETLEKVRKIKELRDQGKKWREIGLALDLTLWQCWYLLNYYGDRLDQR